jgi:hypothetical protein
MYLEVTDEKNSKQAFVFDKNKILIGRSKEADLRLEGDEISRKHIHLEFINGKYYVEDLGAANGVFVNQVKIAAHSRVEVQTFFPLQIGPHIFIQIVEKEDKSSEDPAQIIPNPGARKKDDRSGNTTKHFTPKLSDKEEAEAKKAKMNIIIIGVVFLIGGFYAYTPLSVVKPVTKQAPTQGAKLTEGQIIKKSQDAVLTPAQIVERNLLEIKSQTLCQTSEEKVICDHLFPALGPKEGIILRDNILIVYRNLSVLHKTTWGAEFDKIEAARRYDFMLSYMAIQVLLHPDVKNQKIGKVEFIDFKLLPSGEIITRAKAIVTTLSNINRDPKKSEQILEMTKMSGDLTQYDQNLRKAHIVSFFLPPEEINKDF